MIELIDRGSNDISTTRRTIVHKHSSQRNTCQHTANDHRHKVLSFAHQFEGQTILLLWYQVLCYHQHKIECKDGEDSFHQELHTQNLQGYHEQNTVNDNIGVLQVESCGIVDDSRETCNTSSNNLIRHQEDSEGNGIDKEAKGYEHIVPGFTQYHFVLNGHITFLIRCLPYALVR